MKKVYLCLFMLFIIVIFSFQTVYAEQSGMIIWDRTYGGNEGDSASSFIQSSDGGYAVAGYTSSKGAGGSDFWVLKLDSRGSLLWDRTYGGRDFDRAYSLIQTSDGGYVVAGETCSKGPAVVKIGGEAFYSKDPGLSELWVIKLDRQGKRVWDNVYGGSDRDGASSIIQTTDGGYAVAGYYEFHNKRGYDLDFWILKLDSQGDLLWDRTYGGNKNDEPSSLIQTRDGGYAVIGETQSEGVGKADFWLLKLDNQGNLLWEKTFGGNKSDEPSSLIQTRDGSLVIAGETRSYGAGGSDLWLLKLDSHGNMIWDWTYGGNKEDSASSLIQTTDGGYAVAGYTKSYGAGWADLWLLKLDSHGNILWNRTYGGSSGDYASSLVQTTDGGYAIAGHTESTGDGNANMWILKLDDQGNLEKIEKKGQEQVMKASTKDKTADLTLVVITSPTFLFNLGKHDLTVKIEGPTNDWKIFDDVRGEKPVTVNFYDIPQGHYKVTAKYDSKTIRKEIDIYGVTFDFEMTF